MGDSIPSLKEIKDSIIVFVIFSLTAISFWTWFYYNMSNIIELLLKNIWTMMFLFIIFWIIPSLFVYIIANSLNKNVSFLFLRSLSASLLSNIIYILISLSLRIIFAPFPYISQILVIIILFIVLLMVFIFIYASIFHVDPTDAFKIVSTYAFISTLIMISIVYIITFNLG
jgi:hypothetical protein